MQAAYVPPVAAYNAERDEEEEDDRRGFNAAFAVRRMHAAANAKAMAAGELESPGGQPVATGGSMDIGYDDDGRMHEMDEQVIPEEELSAHDRKVPNSRLILDIALYW